jgi:hypothetical protein
MGTARRAPTKTFASFAPFAVEIGFHLSPVSRLLIPDTSAESLGAAVLTTNLYLMNREIRIRAKKYRPFASFAPFAVKIGFHLIPDL